MTPPPGDPGHHPLRPVRGRRPGQRPADPLGASTNIGAELVARARLDGPTILSADNAVLAFNAHLFAKLPFHPEKNFSDIGAIGRFPLALVVHPDFPAKAFAEFLATVKANPGKVNYASPGNGSPHHLTMDCSRTAPAASSCTSPTAARPRPWPT